MTFGDLVAISSGNLWRMKLRASLTIAGVIIAIGAFVAMLSFGAGNRRLVSQQFEELGLFFTMTVHPAEADSAAALDAAAVARIAALPGVRVAYPFDSFSVTARLGDAEVQTRAMALPAAAARTKLYSRLAAGEPFVDDASREVLVGAELLEDLGVVDADSVVGLPLVLSVTSASVDSGVARVLSSRIADPQRLMESVRLDSLQDDAYRRGLLTRELGVAMQHFLAGVMEGGTTSDTLRVSGVLRRGGGRRFLRREPVVLPEATARRFSAAGPGADPLALFGAIREGSLFGREAGEDEAETYPRITLDLDERYAYSAVADSVAAMGFETFSFAEEFDQIRRVFFYFDLALSAIGLIALVTAALGIINTMLMSIGERRREIGVLKSLGANDGDVRRLFLVESAVIGAIGSALGILLGWTVSRVASAIARGIMARQEIEPMDLFATPPWLVLIALAFGIGVSLVAGTYPAGRAARVDPVQALRQE